MKKEKIDKKIFYALLFPALIEALCSRIFHLTDSIMLGQMTDSTPAVAAVGLCGAPTNLIISAMSAFFVGTTATIAWYYGAKDKKSVHTVAWQTMRIALVVATLFTFISITLARPLISFICGDNEFLEIAISYYKINAYGFFFQILTMNVTAILRGIGISKTPMVYNISSGFLNVILNYLLIFGKFGFPELRSDGAALATTISKAAAFIFAILLLMFKNTDVKYKKGVPWKLCSGIKTRFFPIGLTAAGEQIILQIGAVFTAKIISVLSVAEIAANQIVINIESFAWATGAACQTAATSLFGRFLGAKDEPKARRYLRLSLRWAIYFAVAEILFIIIPSKQIAMLFTNDTALHPIISTLLIISAFTMIPVNSHQTISGALRSAGDSIAPLIASFISLWVFRVGLGFVTVSILGLGIYTYRACISLDQLVRFFIVSIFYLTGHWKKFIVKKV